MTQTIQLRTTQVGPWGMNTYALVCEATGESVLFDPGADPDKLSEMLAGSQPVAILLTHTHADHVMALQEMKDKLQVPLLFHPGAHADNFGEYYSGDADRYLNDGDTFTFGNQTLHVVHTPGHIGDQICFLIEGDDRIIVGDTIFEGGPGRTWSSAGFQQSLQTLTDVVLQWPDEVVCYPGHGPYFRLGDIRARVEAFAAKEHGDFFGDAEWGM